MSAAIDKESTNWVDICSVDDLQNDSGVCALLNGQQIAIFKFSRSGKIYAIDNFDPFGNANVLSRGIVGDVKGQPVVASPLYKQHFNLETGVCLEDESVTIRSFEVRLVGGSVQLSI